MLSGFLSAAKISIAATGSKHTPTEQLDYAAVTWRDALIAAALMAVLQTVLLIVPFAEFLSVFQTALFQIAAMNLLGVAVAFVVIGAATMMSSQREKLPLVTMATALIQIFFLLAQYAMSMVGWDSGSGFAVLGGQAAMMGRLALSILGLPMGPSILIGLLVLVGALATTALLFVLPEARVLLQAMVVARH